MWSSVLKHACRRPCRTEQFERLYQEKLNLSAQFEQNNSKRLSKPHGLIWLQEAPSADLGVFSFYSKVPLKGSIGFYGPLKGTFFFDGAA